MTHPYRSPDEEPGSHEQRYPVADTEVFPTAYSDHPYGRPPSPVQQRPMPQQGPPPAQRPPMGPGPLAHEGGLPYGTPPAPVSPPPRQFVPQHLAVPQQFPPGPYGPAWQSPHPYMHPQPPVQQNVHVHNGRRVNHVLHLVLTVLTGGLWLPVWMILAIANS